MHSSYNFWNSLRHRLVFLLWTCFLSFLSAQIPEQPDKSELAVYDLPFQEEVTAILQDHFGYYWIGTNNGLYRYDGREFTRIDQHTGIFEKFSTDAVTCLMEDDQNRLWIGTQGGIVQLSANREAILFLHAEGQKNDPVQELIQVDDKIWYLKRHSRLCRLPLPKKKPHQASIPFTEDQVIFQSDIGQVLYSKDGFIWIIAEWNKVLKYDKNGRLVKAINFDRPIYRMKEDMGNNHLIINTYDNLVSLDTKSYEVEELYSFDYEAPFVPSVNIRHLNTAPDGSLWLLSEDAYWIQYTERGTHFSERFFSNPIGKDVKASVSYFDNFGRFWIARRKGLSIITIKRKLFDKIPNPPSLDPGELFSTRGIQELYDGSLMIGGYAGFFRYYPWSQTYSEYQLPEKLSGQSSDFYAFDFLLEKDSLYIGTDGQGLYAMSLGNSDLHPVWPDSVYGPNTDGGNQLAWIFSLHRDARELLWMGTRQGISVYSPEGGLITVPFPPEKELSATSIECIMEGDSGTLWLGTANGLFSISSDRQQVVQHSENENVTAIQTFSDGSLWVATNGNGLKHYEPASGKWDEYTVQDGLAHNQIFSMLPYKEEHLWLGTYNGLSSFRVESATFKNYEREDGLANNEFNRNSTFITRNGKYYFGSIDGIISFYPQEINASHHSSRILLSKLIQYKATSDRLVTRTLGLETNPHIRVGPNENYLEVHFTTDQPHNGTQQRFEYQIPSLHEEWIDLGSANYIRLVGLPPGSYQLTIRGTDTDGAWITPQLRVPITVEQIWYRSPSAYLLFSLIAVAVIGLIFAVTFRWMKLNKELALERDYGRKLQEIDETKSSFFTNTAHELKTPLTLIQGPAEAIVQKAGDANLTRMGNLILKQSKQLLELVNQLLLLSRLEAKVEHPRFARLDIVQFCRLVTENFQEAALQKNIELAFENPAQESLLMDADADMMEKVLNNLLSNAIKFTGAGGEVLLSLTCSTEATDQQQLIKIEVSDTGLGIDPEELDLIFKRFYQSDPSPGRQQRGAGIGLALTKDLVELHRGNIKVSSEYGSGTTFTIRLPRYQDQTELAKPEPRSRVLQDFKEAFPELPTSGEAYKEVDGPLLLLVEDHFELMDFIAGNLSGQYRIIKASNGAEAQQLAIQHIPDLVISDVMMPKMDGLTLTRLLKKNEKTSHIPVVLLTAKGEEVNRMEGRRQGADAYLSKPFQMEELNLVLRNLLRLRKRMAEQLSSGIVAGAGVADFPTTNEQSFYQRVLGLIEEHLEDPNFKVEQLAKAMNMSRTQLHRKLKATSDQSALQVIRSVRLQKALELLEQTDLQVAEIAYRVGFNSPSYFTEVFQRFYKKLPSDCRAM